MGLENAQAMVPPVRAGTDIPETLAELLARHGTDPRADSRFHLRPHRPAGMAAVVHAGTGPLLAVTAAITGVFSVASFAAAAVLGTLAVVACIALRRRAPGNDSADAALSVALCFGLALVYALAGGSPPVLGGIAGVAALVVAIGLLSGERAGWPARIAAPVMAVSGTLAFC